MQDFTDNLIAATGLDASTAKAAIGEVLLFLRDKAPLGRVAEYVASAPQAQEAVKAAESAENPRLAQVIEGLTRFTGHGRADVNVLIGELIGLGLDETQIRRVFDETLSRAEDLLGAAGVREVRDILFGAPAPMQPTTAAPIIVPPAEAPTTKLVGDSLAAAQNYRTRETVGVFSDEETLETAVDELNVAGFRDAAISVLASAGKTKGGLSRIFRNVTEIEDSAEAQQTEFVSSDSRVEGTAALIGVPLYIGGAAGVWAVSAAGGSLAFALASAVALGGIGAGLGAILALAIHTRHEQRVREQLKLGGLVLWVSTPTAENERRAAEILRNLGARDVHVHEVQRKWSLDAMPLTHGPYDPFVSLLPDTTHQQPGADTRE